MKVIAKVFVHAKERPVYDAETGTWSKRIEYEIFPFDMTKSLTDRSLVGEQEVTVEVPDDFDIRAGLVASIEREKQRVTAEFQARITQLNGEIQKHLAITMEAP